ncbi:unnamed protein product, partial [Ilex paraguariensis]
MLNNLTPRTSNCHWPNLVLRDFHNWVSSSCSKRGINSSFRQNIGSRGSNSFISGTIRANQCWNRGGNGNSAIPYIPIHGWERDADVWGFISGADLTKLE